MQVVVENYQVPPLDQVISNKGLWIYSPALVSSEDGKAKLVWRVEVTTASISPIHEIVLVDAQSGEVALHFNQTGTAKILFTYNAGNGTSLPGTFVCDKSDLSCASGDADAQAAHSYASDFYDFFWMTISAATVWIIQAYPCAPQSITAPQAVYQPPSRTAHIGTAHRPSLLMQLTPAAIRGRMTSSGMSLHTALSITPSGCSTITSPAGDRQIACRYVG